MGNRRFAGETWHPTHGQAGKTGLAISLMLEDEIHQLKNIERYINYKIQLFSITEDGEKEIKLDAKPKEKRGRGLKLDVGDLVLEKLAILNNQVLNAKLGEY